MTADQQPTLYHLFDETDLQYWKQKMQEGELPTPEQLALLLEKNPDEPLPAWLRPVIVKAIRGELKGKRGRSKRVPFNTSVFGRPLPNTRTFWRGCSEPTRRNLKGAPQLQPRGARTRRPISVQLSDWKLSMSWRSFLNEISPKINRGSIRNAPGAAI